MKRNVGRPPQSEEERQAKERTIDTHFNLPESLVKAVDAEKRTGESRKDCIVRLLNERLNFAVTYKQGDL